MKNFKNGFTLAEVLVTMSVIGVVAALTVPGMMTSGKYQELSTRVSKFVSTTENAAMALAATNGEITISNSENDLDGVILYKTRTGTAPHYSYTLRDGTIISISPINGSINVNNFLAEPFQDASKYGTPVAILNLHHKVNVTPKLKPTLVFVLTRKGYVFPHVQDACVMAMFDIEGKNNNPWKLTKQLAEGVCSAASGR